MTLIQGIAVSAADADEFSIYN